MTARSVVLAVLEAPSSANSMNIKAMLRRKRVDEAPFADKVKVAMDFMEYIAKQKRKVALAHSLGKGASVVYDMMVQSGIEFTPFVVSTRFMSREVVEVLQSAIHEIPTLKVVNNARHIQKGVNTMNRNFCCHHLKVMPAGSFINSIGATVWFTGLRKSDQTHRKVSELEDSETKLLRVNPILTWDEWDVEQYLERYEVLMFENYHLVDCSCCPVDTLGVLRWSDSVKQCGGCGK